MKEIKNYPKKNMDMLNREGEMKYYLTFILLFFGSVMGQVSNNVLQEEDY